MSDPNNALRWIVAALCCFPWPGGVLAGILLATLFQRGFLSFRIDRSKAPSLRWWRNGR